MTVNFCSSRSRSATSSRSTGSCPEFFAVDWPLAELLCRPSLGAWTLGTLILGACSLTVGLGARGISVTVPLGGRVARPPAAATDDDHVRQVLLGVDVVLSDLLRLLLDECRVGGDLLGARGEAGHRVDVPVGGLVDQLALVAARVSLDRDNLGVPELALEP